MNREKPGDKKQLCIIFIIYYPINGEYRFPGDDMIKVFFQNLGQGYFRYKQYIKCDLADIYFITCLPGNDQNPFSPNTCLQKLNWQEGSYHADTVANFGAVNLGNKDVLSTILKFVVHDSAANEYILFFFNHSSNFGLGKNVADPAPEGRAIVKAVKEIVSRPGIPGSSNFGMNTLTRSLNFAMAKKTVKKIVKHNLISGDTRMEEFRDDFTDDMLTNSELSIALLRAFDLDDPKRKKSRKPIKIIFSAGCYFQNIDTAYSLRDYADYLIGAQGIMPAKSFDYPAIINSILNRLNDARTLTGSDYRIIINATLRNFGKPYMEDGDDTLKKMLPYCYVSCLDTKHLDDLTSKFNNFLEFYVSRKDFLDKILSIRTQLKDISDIYQPDDQQIPLYIFDFKYFIEQVKSLDKLDNAVYTELLEALNYVIGPRAFVDPETNMQNCSGLSIYFPESIESALKTYNFTTFYSPVSDKQSYFAEDSYWPDFLFYYYKKLSLNFKKLQSKTK